MTTSQNEAISSRRNTPASSTVELARLAGIPEISGDDFLALIMDLRQRGSVGDWLATAEQLGEAINNSWLVCISGPDDGCLVGTVTANDHAEAKAAAQARWPRWASDLHVFSGKAVAKIHEKYRRRIARDPFPLAFHEAGHAIIARHYGAEIVGVDIIPRMLSANHRFSPYGSSFGRTTVDRPLVGRTKTQRRREAEETMVYVLAGTAAEARYRPGRNHRTSDESDMAAISHLLCSFRPGDEEAYLKEMKARARELVREHWTDIQTVATALVDRHELIGDDIDDLLKDRLAVKPG